MNDDNSEQQSQGKRKEQQQEENELEDDQGRNKLLLPPSHTSESIGNRGTAVNTTACTEQDTEARMRDERTATATGKYGNGPAAEAAVTVAASEMTKDKNNPGLAVSSSGPTAAAAAPQQVNEEDGTSRGIKNNSGDDDLAVAQRLQTLEQLTSIFGFPSDVAEQAVDAVGYDVTACYNYILDRNMADDSGGPIVPIDNCPHLEQHIQMSHRHDGEGSISAVLKGYSPQDAPCSHFEGTTKLPGRGSLKEEVDEDGSCPSKENWMCLECGAIRCSRYKNGHGLAHWEESKESTTDESGHCVAVSLSDLSVWCYICNAYVRHPNFVDPLVRYLESLKFGPIITMGESPAQKHEKSEQKPSQHSDTSPPARLNTPPPPDEGCYSTPPGASASKHVSPSHQYGQQEEKKPSSQCKSLPHLLSPILPSPIRKKQRTSIQAPNLDIDIHGEASKNTVEGDTTGMEQLSLSEDRMQTESDNDDEHDEEPIRMPARGVPLELDDDPGDDEQEGDEQEEVDENLIQMLAQAAAAQGLSLEWIIEQARAEHNGEDTQPVEYPFERFPTSLADVAEFIQSDKCRRILILAGAGMSVSSGIPDFRSAGTGLYSTLDATSLTCSPAQQAAIRQDPSFALDQHLFLENPLPLLETKRDFILGTYEHRWKATLAHRFVELLHVKTGKLVRLYTQNIDGLEDQCSQLPEEKIIPVHGSMDRAECARCNTRTSFSDFCHQVRNQIKDISGRDSTAPSDSTAIPCTTCGYNALKPAIVLFRSSMPQEFFANIGPDCRNVDLLIVIGTSLKVAPANSLVWRVPRSALRVLINREVVGEHLGMDFETSMDPATSNSSSNNAGDDENNDDRGGATGRDFFTGGNCDEVLLELMEHLGWLSDLESLLVGEQLPEASAHLLHERLENSRRSGDRSDRNTHRTT